MSPQRQAASLLIVAALAACHTAPSVESAAARAVVDRVGERFKTDAAAPRLIASGAGLQPEFAARPEGTVRPAELLLPLSAEGAFTLADVSSGLRVRARLVGAEPSSALVANGHAVYLNAFAGGDLVHRPNAEGNEDFVVLAAGSAVRELTYNVTLEANVASLRLLDNQLELLDALGAPRLRIAPPSVVDGEGTRREARLSVIGCAVETDRRLPWGRTHVAPGATECTVRLAWNSEDLKGSVVVDPAWQTTGSTTNAHYQHAALALANGRVLICGNGTSEIYDYSTGSWATNGGPTACQTDVSLVFLQSGKVLAAGGSGASHSIWDPATGGWSDFPAYSGFGAGGAKVVALTDGTIVGVGGYTPCSGSGCSGGATSMKTFVKFNQSTNSWGNLGSLLTERRFPMAASLPDNTALVCGGLVNQGFAAHDCELLTATGTSTQVLGPLPNGFQIGQEPHSGMVSLPDGSVFLNCHYGNQGGSPGWIGDSWTYKSGWSSATLSVDRCDLTAAPLAVGKTLFVGGLTFDNTAVSAVDILNGGATTSLSAGRYQAAAALISDGRVLVTGGQNSTGVLRTSLVYTAPVTCSAPTDCLSGFCVDGYCCNSACNSGCGQCDSPGVEGWCSARPDGAAGAPSCAPFVCDGTALTCEASCAGDSDCAATAWCDGNHKCQFKSAPGGSCSSGDECLVGFCVDNVCCDQQCDGACEACTVAAGATTNGACVQLVGAAGSPSCAPFVCGGTSDCPTSCGTSDTLCIATDYCDGVGACIPKVSYPAVCTSDSQCSTGLCANGVCCNETCADGCGVCTASGGATADGLCTARAASNVGTPSCAPYLCGGSSKQCPATCASDTECAVGNWCDAAHHCVPKAAQGGSCGADNQCGTSLHCTQNVCCNATCQGGCESCTAATGATVDGTCTTLGSGAAGIPGCGNYLCTGSATACPATCASDAGCASSAWCDATNHCVPKVAKGQTCSADDQCFTNHCADTVCCDKACDGACDGCSVAAGASVNGTCATLALGAAGVPACTPFVCDGANVSCPATCATDAQCISSDYCNAAHQCVPKVGAGTSCGGDHECTTSHCADNVCCDSACSGSCDACSVAAGATADGTCTNIAGAGTPTCAPYLCLGTSGTCPGTCQNDSQCATGNYCDAANHCVAKGGQGAGCSANNQCLNSLCADNFCCDKSCGGACDACSTARGSSANGTCAVVALGNAGLPVCAPYVCDGTAATCPATCATDAQCAAADYCDATHHCVLKKTGGSSCGAGNECQSTSCADGFCCDKGCGGSCDVCAAALGATQNGVCTVLPAASAGAPSCAPFVCSGGALASCPTSCTTDANCITGDYCNAAHQCVPKIVGGGSCSGDNQCTTSHCADSKCCDRGCTDSCDVCAAALGATADGTCTNVSGAGAPSCAPYVCGGSASTCPGTCANDAGCSAGNYCDATHHCIPQGVQGATCSAADQCLNGRCVDGVCCNSTCGSGCDVCAASLGAVANGVCTVLAAGAAGTPSCAPYVCSGRESCPTFCTADAQCQSGDYCDGSGACVPLLTVAHTCGSAHECGSGFCAEGICCDQACLGSCERCDMAGHAGTCTPVAAGPSEACLPLRCDGTSESCPTLCLTNGDCADGFACLAGTCTPERTAGASCTQAAECGSGFCVDGVCCNSACEGACAACALPGHLGTCSLVTGASAPGRTACDGTGLCAATCDGQHSGCQFPAATTSCGPAFCSQATATEASFCDGSGVCVAGAQVACGAGCDGERCVAVPKSAKAGCASSADIDLAALLTMLMLTLVRWRRVAFKGAV